MFIGDVYRFTRRFTDNLSLIPSYVAKDETDETEREEILRIRG